MIVFEDLLNYQSGIYSHRDGTIIGAHAILLVGWGKIGSDAESEEYWEVKNSWGTDWGEDGYFRIRMGDSETASELFGGGFSCKPYID